jgi:hypothetical protein
MQLMVVRQPSDAACTLGKMYVNGAFECYTLEDTVRPVKIQNATAIPAGLYFVEVTMSPHFGKPLPLLKNVPNYEGVRIHSGNTAADTEGCILVGDGEGRDVITQSRVAFDRLFAKIQQAMADGEQVTILIR